MDVPILRHLRPCTQLQISGRSTNMMMAATHVSLYPTPVAMLTEVTSAGTRDCIICGMPS